MNSELSASQEDSHPRSVSYRDRMCFTQGRRILFVKYLGRFWVDGPGYPGDMPVEGPELYEIS